MLRQYQESKVHTEIKKLETKDLDQVCSNLSALLKSLLETNTASFNRKAETMLIPESGWDTKVVSHKEDLKSHLITLIENCKQKLLDRLASTSQKQ
jgi:hypothetical protein